MTIGRRKTCDICLDFPNVSGTHAELSLKNGVWYVRDLGSTNGVKVNGERTLRRPLRPGDEISVANHKYTIHYQLAAGSTLAAGDVDDLFESRAQLVQSSPHRDVEIASPLAAPRDEERVRGYSGPARDKTLAQRHPRLHGEPGLDPLLGAGQGRANGGRAAREHSRGQARSHILLMQHVRDAAQAGTGNRGRHHVAAHAEHDVRLEAVDDAEARAKRGGKDRGKREVLPPRVAVEALHPDRGELEAGLGHQALLRTAGTPDKQHVT